MAADINTAWQDYTGKAIEPVVRTALERLLPDPCFGAARYVGSYWTRDHQTEVDLVGTEKDDDNRRVEFAGSVKWRARKYFAMADVAELALGQRARLESRQELAVGHQLAVLLAHERVDGAKHEVAASRNATQRELDAGILQSL